MPYDMWLTYFSGNILVTKGVVCVELTVGSKSLPTTFFVVDAKRTYNILLAIYYEPKFYSMGWR